MTAISSYIPRSCQCAAFLTHFRPQLMMAPRRYGGLYSLFLLGFAARVCLSSTTFENIDLEQHVIMPSVDYGIEYFADERFDGGAETAQIPSSQPLPSRRGSWLGWGADVYNNHWAGSDATINKSNVKSLTKVCAKEYNPGVSAAPFIETGIAYSPTWNGLLVALD